MDTPKETSEAQRRSIRIRWEISIRLTSLDPATPFTEQAQTLVVNPQGCGVRLGRPVPPGMPVQIDGSSRWDQRNRNGGKLCLAGDGVEPLAGRSRTRRTR